MNKYYRIMVVLAVFSVLLPMSAKAREAIEIEDDDEISESPRLLGKPEMSERVHAPKSSEVKRQDEEARQTPNVSVPPKLEKDVEKLTEDDDNITDISVSDTQERVEVKYRLRAKLFGIVDVPYELHANIDAKAGTIQAKGPWWLVFARDNLGDVKTALQSDQELHDATNQGSVLSRMIAILKSLAQ